MHKHYILTELSFVYKTLHFRNRETRLAFSIKQFDYPLTWRQSPQYTVLEVSIDWTCLTPRPVLNGQISLIVH